MRHSVTVAVLTAALLLLDASPTYANDACLLLKPADAEAVFGSPVENAIDDVMTSGGMTALQCRYLAVEKPVRYADLSVTRYDSAELFEMLQEGASEESDEAVADLGERAVWHKQSGSLSVFFGTEEVTLHVFNQPEQFSKEQHIALMREILARR